MQTRKLRFLSLAVSLAFAAACSSPPRPLPTASSEASRASSTAAPARIQSFNQLPLYFVENQGQTDPRVAFYLPGRNQTIYFTPAGLTFAFTSATANSADPALPVPPTGRLPSLDNPADAFGEQAAQRWAVKLDFVGANPNVHPAGESKTAAVFSYFKGQQSQWRAGVSSYAQLRYPNLWPGIDLVYSGQANQLKYEFLVQPGADPGRIQMAYRGANSVRLTADGALEVTTPLGGFRDAVPMAYQLKNGRRVAVAMSYAPIRDSGPDGRYTYAFRLGAYDPSLAVVLDPAVLVYGGYIGGSGDDHGQSIAVDRAGNAYITGWTTSDAATFPENGGPDLTYSGNQDAFVAKVNAAGTALVYAGYLGGSAMDFGYAIAVDAAGNAYVTGLTYSDQASFPVTTGPDLTYHGSGDAFVAKVNASGTALVYSGYIGGAGFDAAVGIALDSSGNAYVTGATMSDQTSFPVTVGPDLTINGGQDAFIAKVNAAGTSLVYAGYIGGARDDKGYAVAVDDAGSAYITGWTLSDQTSFPVSGGPGLIYKGGTVYGDAFVAKVNAAGTAIVYAGYIGGAGEDLGNGIAVDSAGYAYIVGDTSSDQTTFPVTVGPDLTYNGGNADAFVAKVNPAGTALVYAGFIGGANGDQGQGIAIDGAGNAYVVGSTQSDQSSFPVAGGPDLTYNGNEDAFVAEVNAAGAALNYASYIGGSGQDQGFSIALDSAGNAYLTGDTRSSQATFPVAIGPDLTYNGAADAFVVKVSTAHTWTGAIDADWKKPGNWSPRGVPAAGDGLDCLIPGGLAIYPSVLGSTIGCDGNLTIAAGAQLTTDGVNDSFGRVVTLAGTWQASSLFDFHATNSTVDVRSSGDLVLNNASIGYFSTITPTVNAVSVVGSVLISGTVQLHHGTSLVIQPAGHVRLPLGGSLEIDDSGSLTNTGTLEQVKLVTGPTEFLHITDGATTDKYLGLVITPTAGSLVTTTVTLQGQQPCTTGTVARCYTINPSSVNPATIEFYYSAGEANGNTAPNAYHWNGAAWEALSSMLGGSGIGSFVVATGITGYSPFALKDSPPIGVPFVHLFLPAIFR